MLVINLHGSQIWPHTCMTNMATLVPQWRRRGPPGARRPLERISRRSESWAIRWAWVTSWSWVPSSLKWAFPSWRERWWSWCWWAPEVRAPSTKRRARVLSIVEWLGGRELKTIGFNRRLRNSCPTHGFYSALKGVWPCWNWSERAFMGGVWGVSDFSNVTVCRIRRMGVVLKRGTRERENDRGLGEKLETRGVEKAWEKESEGYCSPC